MRGNLHRLPLLSFCFLGWFPGRFSDTLDVQTRNRFVNLQIVAVSHQQRSGLRFPNRLKRSCFSCGSTTDRNGAFRVGGAECERDHNSKVDDHQDADLSLSHSLCLCLFLSLYLASICIPISAPLSLCLSVCDCTLRFVNHGLVAQIDRLPQLHGLPLPQDGTLSCCLCRH